MHEVSSLKNPGLYTLNQAMMAYGVLSLILSFLIYAPPPLLEDSIVPSTLEAIILFIIAFFELRFLSSLFGILNIYCTNSEREKKNGHE